MKIINNFLNDTELKQFYTHINQCTNKVPGVPYNDDDAIQGFNNSFYIDPTDEFKEWWINLFKYHNKIVSSLTSSEVASLQIVQARYPYCAQWHQDSFKDMLLGSILYYFGDAWDSHDGGLFITKENSNDNYGTWVAPTTNTCIINPKDILHAVTPYTNKEKVRKAVFMFLQQKDFL